MTHKHLSLLLLGGIIYVNTFSQPTIVAQKAIGGSSADDLASIYLTKDSGLIIGGSSDSKKSFEKTQNSRGESDYWMVKLDKLENIKWDKTIGGSSTDNLSFLQQTSDGGYILGGESYSNKSGEKTQNNRGSRLTADYWVVKLDRFRNIQWDKTIGGSSFDFLTCLQQTSDGGYILGGRSFSNKSGEKTQDKRGAYDYWVVKLDGLGNIQWDRTIGGSDQDYLQSLQQTADGGYILGGYSASNRSGEKTQNSKGAEDFWIVKLNSQGQIEWDKTIGGNNSEDFGSLQQTSDGGYILGGSSYSNKSQDKTQNSRGAIDYWVVKLNKFGNIQWDKTIGGSDAEWLYSIQQTRDGGYILGGESYSNKSGEKTENSGGDNDYWIVKVNNLGNVQWDKTIGTTDFDFFSSIKEVGNNQYVVAGTSVIGISGDKTVASRDGNDYWLIWLMYQTPTALVAASSENENSIAGPYKNKSNEFIAYPNPAKDVLHVQTNGKAFVSLTDQSGKVLLTQTIEGSGIINISNLTPGIYYLKNRATGEVQKVLVAK